jgi:hypothetical protein
MEVMSQRLLYIILAVACLIVTLAWPVRALLADEFPANDRGDSGRFFCYVMAGLFGALTLVFSFRAWRAGRPVASHGD